MNIYISLLFATIRSALRAREDVALENLALRHQLAVMTRSARRPRLGPADRLLWCWLSRRWSRWRSALFVVQPDTIVRWHRTAWRQLLDVEEPPPTRPAAALGGGERSDPEDGPRQPALGQRAYPGRTS